MLRRCLAPALFAAVAAYSTSSYAAASCTDTSVLSEVRKEISRDPGRLVQPTWVYLAHQGVVSPRSSYMVIFEAGKLDLRAIRTTDVNQYTGAVNCAAIATFSAPQYDLIDAKVTVRYKVENSSDGAYFTFIGYDW